jgi:hypothetical protein
MIGDSIVSRIMCEVIFSSMAAMMDLALAEVLDGAWARSIIDNPIVHRVMHEVGFSSMGLTSAEVLDSTWARLRIDDPIISCVVCQVGFSSMAVMTGMASAEVLET